MNTRHLIDRALNAGQGVLHLKPTWVPRDFAIPGRRLKLYPSELYAFGANRGGIDERWLCSTVCADNGPATSENEGLSCVVVPENSRHELVLLRDAVDSLGAAIIGERLMKKYGRLPVFAKFFDNLGPLPFHMHQMRADAEKVGQEPKPEAYFFPTQLNNYGGRFPYTYFGFRPGTTRDQVRRCLAMWNEGDNHITDLSLAYPLKTGTGWDVPAGVLHAPGSLLTYEPQYASDIAAMFESLVDDQPIPVSQLTRHVPTEHQDDLDYIVNMLDWDLNLDPNLASNRFMAPLPVNADDDPQEIGYHDEWIAYRSAEFSARQTTILPNRSVKLVDAAAYGAIIIQGHGKLGVHEAESPTLIHFDQITQDEFWVTEDAAQAGLTVINDSPTEPLVILRHYGPENPELVHWQGRAR